MAWEESSDEEEEEKPKPSKRKQTKKRKYDNEDQTEKKKKKTTKSKEPSSEEDEPEDDNQEDHDDDEEEKPAQTSIQITDPSKLSLSDLDAALEERGLTQKSGSKAAKVNLLRNDMAKKGQLEPAYMNIEQLRAECEKLGLETVGSKAVLIHRVTVEKNRLGGKSTEQFDPSLLTVAQLKAWLDKQGVEFEKGKTKAYYVKLVQEAVEEEEEDKKENDIEMMSTEQLIGWLSSRNIKLPKKTKNREFYAALVEANMTTPGVMLFDEDEILLSKKLFFGQRLLVVKGDLSRCSADAVVHPTDNTLVLGGGVGQALDRASGSKFRAGVTSWYKAHASAGGLPMTECCMTAGEELNCSNVIHTNSPRFDHNDTEGSKQELADSIDNLLSCADDNQLSNIALPSIGSGVNGYPPDVAAATILQAITGYFQNVGVVGSSLKEVYFVLFDAASVNTYKSQLQNL